MDLKSTYNKIAEDWHKDHHDDDWWIPGTDKLISLLSPGASVLDIGCGSGVKSNYLSERGFKVIGLDFSEKMIEIAKREVPKASFEVRDLYDLDLLTEKFDCVFAQASLLHIPKKDIAMVLGKFKKRLNKNGLLYVAVKEAKLGRPEEETKKENDYGYDFQRFFSYFTLPELIKFIMETGLEIVDSFVQNAGKTNWVQVIAVNRARA